MKPPRTIYRVQTKDGPRRLCDFHIQRSKPPVVGRRERIENYRHWQGCEDCSR